MNRVTRLMIACLVMLPGFGVATPAAAQTAGDHIPVVQIVVSESIGVADSPGGGRAASITSGTGRDPAVAYSERQPSPVSLNVTEAIAVSDSPRLLPSVPLTVNETIAVSDSPRAVRMGWSASPTVNLPLSILPDNQMYPKIIMDAKGDFFTGWLDWLDGHPTFNALKVYVQKVDAGGNILWQVNGVPASPVIAQSMNGFELESDGLGGVYVVWNCAYMDLNGNGTLDEGEYLNHDRLYAQRLNALGQQQWVNPVRVFDMNYDVEAHSVVSDGQNGVIVHWISDYPHERPFATGGSREVTVPSVCVQRINLAGDRLWGNYGIQVFEPWDQSLNGGSGSAYGSVSSFYALTVSDNAGGAFLGFNFYRGSSSESYMEAIHIDSTGLRTVGFQTSEGTVLGVNISPSPGDAGAIPSGDGGAIIAWQTNYGSGSAYPDIYAQKVGSDGSILWGAGGVAVCTADYIQGKVVGAVPPGLDLDTDGDGGAIIAWEDYRYQATVYARRVDRNGNALWGSDGIAVARTDLSFQYEPRVSADGQGGAIVSWSSYIYGSDILAQRLNGNGDKLWLQDMAITTANGNQNWHQAIPDGHGGAVAVWMDSRDATTSSDIYAQGIMSNGSLPSYYTMTMAVNPAGAGTTNPGVGAHVYEGGTVVPITAVPANGWRFLNWSGADNNTANPSTVTMSTNKTVTANFGWIAGRIWGRILRNGQPAPNEMVVLYDHSSTPYRQTITYTDSAGVYDFTGLTEGTYDLNHDAYRQGGSIIEGIGYFQTKPVVLGTSQPGYHYQDIDLAFSIASPLAGSEFLVSPSHPVTFSWSAYYLATGYMVAFADSSHLYLGHLDSTTLTQSICNGSYTDNVGAVRAFTPGEYYWHIFMTPQPSCDFNAIQSTSRQFRIRGQSAPNPPSNTSPTNGAASVTITPVLRCSTFADPDAGDSHAASQWQIRTASGSYASPVFDSGTDNVSLVQITVPSGVLSLSTTYYWHVRHIDSHGAWSGWSTETSFTTSVINYNLTINIVGNGTTSPGAGVHAYPSGTSVNVTAAPGTSWYFSHWSGNASGSANPVTIVMSDNKTVTANFAPRGITLIGAIKQNPAAYAGQTVRLRGQFRGWESGHGVPPVTRSDWAVQDSTGSMYVTGSSSGLRHPGDIGKPVTVTGIVRLKNGQSYIEGSRNLGP